MATIARIREVLDDGHPVTGAYDPDTKLAHAELYIENVPVIYPLSMLQFRNWASVESRGFKIREAIDDTLLSDQVRNVAYILDKLLGTDSARLDPDNATHVAMINELVSASVIDASDRTALGVEGTTLVSVIQNESLGHVALCDIEKARLLP
jgi:hypothetical protein